MSETTAIVPLTQDQAQAIEARQNSLLLAAQDLVVDCPDGEKIAWEIVNGIGALTKAIQADFKPAKTGAHGAWKAICAQEASHLERLKEPDRIVRGKLSTWEAEKRRIAEIERKAREAAAERVATELRREAQEKAQKEAEERRLAEAVAAEAAGNTAEAEELLETPVEVAPVEVPTVVVPVAAAPKVEGAGAMVERWTFEITDADAIPREYLTVNESAIGKVVQALKGATKIAGVRVYSTLEARRAGRR